MYEDTPQELVHDLFSEAVFGGHALGRPVIGPGRRDLVGRAGGRSRRTTGRCIGPGTSSSPRPATSSTSGCCELLAQRGGEAGRSARTRSAGCARRSCKAPPPGSASSARTPSSTTSASARRASPAPTGGASPPRSWTRSSAAPPRRGSSRRSARSAAWRTPSTASPRSTRTPAWSGSTSARARRTSPRASRSRTPQIADIAGGNLRANELERAKENLKGRIMLSMEATSNRMSRLGKSLITDTELLSLERIIAEIDAVEPESGRRAGRAAARARAAVGGRASARARSGSSRRSSGSTRRSAPARRVRIALLGYQGQGRARAAARARGARARGAADRARGSDRRSRARRRRSTSRGRTPSSANVRLALEQDVPCVVGTTGLGRKSSPSGRGSRRERGARAVRRAELRDRGRADDAARGRGGAATCRAPRSSSSTTRQGATRPPAPRRRPRRRSAAKSRSTRCACPGSSRTRRCSSAARASCSRSATTRSRARRSCRASCSRSSACRPCRPA